MPASTGIFDADGHVFDNGAEIAEFLPPPYHGKMGGNLFGGGGDGWNRRVLSIRADASHAGDPNWIGEHTEGGVNADRWLQILDESGIDGTVLYSIDGVSQVKEREWAVVLAQARNTWMAEYYMRRSPRLKAMAILP